MLRYFKALLRTALLRLVFFFLEFPDLYFFTLQYCIGFAIYQHESATFFLYNIVLVLPYINMKPPWMYMCSQSLSPGYLSVTPLLLLFFNFIYFFILLYNTVLVLPHIDMNPLRVYMSSQS